jgi:hypothetical protein
MNTDVDAARAELKKAKAYRRKHNRMSHEANKRRSTASPFLAAVLAVAVLVCAVALTVDDVSLWTTAAGLAIMAINLWMLGQICFDLGYRTRIEDREAND